MKTFLYLNKGLAGPSPDNQVVIVGGGLAGLAASLSLSKAGSYNQGSYIQRFLQPEVLTTTI